MNLPKTKQTPDDPQRLPPARRRRAKRLLAPLSSSDRETFLDETTRRVSPSFDFFLFSLLAAVTISIGLVIDAPALLVLGVLFAPTLTPIVGLALGTVTGSTRFFFRSLLGILIVCGLVLLTGILAGFIARNFGVSDLVLAYYHAQLTWYRFLVLGIGAVLTTLSLVHSKRRGAVASVALSYEIFVPLAVAGVGLGGGLPHLWPDGLVIFLIHLAFATLLGAILLVILGFRPLTLFGFTLGGVALLAGGIILVGLSGVGAAFWGQVAIPTPVPTATPTATITPTPSNTATLTTTPLPPTSTFPPTFTPSITLAPSETPAPSPTPIYALVDVPADYGGAILRVAPGFGQDYMTSAVNGTLIQILSEKPVLADKVLWLNVRLPDGTEGWMLQSALLAATPAPNW